MLDLDWPQIRKFKWHGRRLTIVTDGTKLMVCAGWIHLEASLFPGSSKLTAASDG